MTCDAAEEQTTMHDQRRRTVTWTRGADGSHDFALNMSSARLVASTIAAFFTCTSTVLAAAWFVARPIIRDEIERQVVPVAMRLDAVAGWQSRHEVYTDAFADQRQRVDEQRERQLREIRDDLTYIRNRLDSLYGQVRSGR